MLGSYKKRYCIIALLISAGIFLRFLLMTFGYNFDFESYCIVGEIAGNFRNVYAETARYNYGPIFFFIQGLLYRLSCLTPHWEDTYRVLMVSVLTLADLGIAFYIANRYGIRKALLFFLNPVSIIITGFHNQFDNIAILLALVSISFYNEEDRFDIRDLFFVLFLSLSLITKHLLCVMPLFILLKKGLPLKKKALYAFVPPLLFLLSFVPFALHSTQALQGIIRNVFLYVSFNNSPLLSFLYDLIGFPNRYSIFVFGLGMAAFSVFTRKFSYERQVLCYLIALVALSSAITNQYLIIPIVALIVLETGLWKYAYLFFAAVYLVLQGDGLGLLPRVIQHEMPQQVVHYASFYTYHAYQLLAWILFIVLIYIVFLKGKIRFWPQKNKTKL